ncbi:DUF4087 domain-containing protein [Kovacikia minuta CCNUW1]|uniref:DUF4087 domain-containing protein n=1 Tax=Kovacikia minuta TaxID=2931930 RepID=UPI001CCB46BB|nr:DUF4087 domain-containing protein [Kovacikia minuta]UBF25473.1 DUF4087 domain-containing protein [Kovacikia minuta CCNUW1]
MKKSFVVCLSLVSVLIGVVPSSSAVEKRCGWLQNPTPANWWLIDRDGTWTISVQGGYRARGMDTIPDLSQREYIATNGSYGYACACMDVTANRRTMRITHIYKTKQLPLRTCRRDPALPQK